MNILEAMQTPALFGDAFAGESWEAWRAVLSGAFGLPMGDDRLALFKQLAGDREPPGERVRELYVIAGRRSAKTQNAAAIAVYLATVGAALEGLTDKLAVGERGTVVLFATDRTQAKIMLGFIAGMIDASPVLSAMVEKRGAEEIHLNNRVSIEVTTSNYRAVRGRAILACIFDELCFLRSESTDAADVEIVRAARPGLATTGGLLIGISSPWAKRGVMYEQYKRHYGQDSDVLVVKGATTQFNPTLDPRVIEEALAEDPEAAKTEWLGEWRDGISSYVDRNVVEGCTRDFPLIVPHQPGHTYTAFVDPSGGSSNPNADEFTMAIGYRDKDSTVVVCGVWARRGSPDDTIEAFAKILHDYNVRTVRSDRYAGRFPADSFARHGITLQFTDKNRSQLYIDALPLLFTGRIELPPDPVLANQLCGLERRTGRTGDVIDHPAGAHDDRANAVAGLAAHAMAHKAMPKVAVRFCF